MRHDFRRAPAEALFLAGGEWSPARSGDRLTALVGCPGCDGTISLRRHEIDPDGVVTPSVVCPLCGWHDYARLKGWRTQ